jgi:hypothetical protein
MKLEISYTRIERFKGYFYMSDEDIQWRLDLYNEFHADQYTLEDFKHKPKVRIIIFDYFGAYLDEEPYDDETSYEKVTIIGEDEE